MARKTGNNGFTLVELMIVVAIIGILAAVAVAAYSIYVRQSHNSEATAILADIRLKQEAYRGTFHRYAKVETDCSGWVPRGTPTSEPATPAERAGFTGGDCETAWRQLGVSFPNKVYFVYSGRAGDPGEALNNWWSDANNGDFWYAAKAIEDLDENGECAGFRVVSGTMEMIRVAEAGAACTYVE
jgi:prepilin-type N-terminal cleavage/methylation domain-containing protein